MDAQHHPRRAEIVVTTELAAAEPTLQLVTRLRDAGGRIAAEVQTAAAARAEQTLVVPHPQLWSPDAPRLYTLESELRRGETVLDRLEQPFGIRIVTMDAMRGFAINGTAMPLRGGAIHHDNGLLGACAFADADERRIRLLKARGYNAIRSCHNIASRSLRHACDRLGMLLIEEAFDAWQTAKLPQDFSTHFAERWPEVIDAMVRSARNSPSVIMWSIGNEIPDRATPAGVKWEWELANAVHRLDPTRPVTAALNGVLGAPMIAGPETARPGRAGKLDNASTIFLDVPGYNYRLQDIEREHADHPERVVYASETFPRNMFDYAALAQRAPYFIGEFVWTAMDYIGEAGVGATTLLKKGNPPFYLPGWPWVISWCGDIDLIGRQKAPSFARDVVWGLSPLEIAVARPIPEGKYENVALWGWSDERQSWSWPGAEGKPLAVRIYSSADRVDLLLNGAKVGELRLSGKDRNHAETSVAYSPGVLEAVAYRAGHIIAQRRLETVGPAATLHITPEQPISRRDRQALSYLAIEVRDAQGRALPDEQRRIALTVDGPAELVGFGSADPLATGSFQAPEAQSFQGSALAILRSRGHPGKVRVEVQSPGLQGAAAVISLV